MRFSHTAGERHRAQHNSPSKRAGGFVSFARRRRGHARAIGASSHAAFGWLLVFAAAGVLGCAGSLPRPPSAPIAASDYVPVPFAPREPPVELVPPSPAKGAVWVDGSWEWTGERYVWRFGSWVLPPPGARRAKWVVVRRPEDGQLFFAPSSWKTENGEKIDDRSWAYALGPRARARTRLGADPGVPPPSTPSERRRSRPASGDPDAE